MLEVKDIEKDPISLKGVWIDLSIVKNNLYVLKVKKIQRMTSSYRGIIQILCNYNPCMRGASFVLDGSQLQWLKSGNDRDVTKGAIIDSIVILYCFWVEL